MSAPKGRVVALDLGQKRIGMAVSDPDRTLASPYSTIDRSGDIAQDHREIFSAVADLGAVLVVVGMPLSMSGAKGPAAVATDKEVEKLRKALPVPVDIQDERLTTVSASRSMTAAGLRSKRQRRGGRIDQEAAAVLLQAYLEKHRRPGVGVGPHGPEEGGLGCPPGEAN